MKIDENFTTLRNLVESLTTTETFNSKRILVEGEKKEKGRAFDRWKRRLHTFPLINDEAVEHRGEFYSYNAEGRGID